MEDEKIVSDLEAACKAIGSLEAHLDSTFKIDGKTRKEWRVKLHVAFPETEMTFADVIRLGSKIANNYQVAAHYRDKQTLTIDALGRAKQDKYNESYQEILDTYVAKTGKALAQKSCEVKASVSVKDIDGAISTLKVTRDFWQKTCDTLHEARRTLEIISRAMAGESMVGRDFVVKAGAPRRLPELEEEPEKEDK